MSQDPIKRLIMSAARKTLDGISSVSTGHVCPVRLLVLAVLCDDFTETQNQYLPFIEDTAHSCSTLSREAILRCPGELILLCCLAQQRRLGKPLPQFQVFMDETVEILNEVAVEEQAAYFACYLLLDQLERHVTRISQYQSYRPGVRSLLMGNAGVPRSCIRQFEYVTCFGIRPYKEDPVIAIALASIMMSAFRKGDISTGSSLLRILSYLGGAEHFATEAARRFLLKSQNEMGGFGLCPPASTKHESYSSDVTLDVSLQCLWALIESVNVDYRLYRDLGRNRYLVQVTQCARRKTETVMGMPIKQ